MKAFSKLKMNRCPMCHNDTLAVHEIESTIYSLNDVGEKDILSQNDYDCEMVCLNCGEVFEANTIGNKWYIFENVPSPKTMDIISFNPFDSGR